MNICIICLFYFFFVFFFFLSFDNFISHHKTTDCRNVTKHRYFTADSSRLTESTNNNSNECLWTHICRFGSLLHASEHTATSAAVHFKHTAQWRRRTTFKQLVAINRIEFSKEKFIISTKFCCFFLSLSLFLLVGSAALHNQNTKNLNKMKPSKISIFFLLVVVVVL